MADNYRRDTTAIDDTLLTPHQAASIWKLAPEHARHRFMNTLYRADEALHDEVLRLCDAADRGTSRRAGGASPAVRPASGE